jgi:hypothetical protein
MAGISRSDRANIGKALLRQLHASGAMARLANVEIERKHRLSTALLGPAHQPAERGLADFSTQQSALDAVDGSSTGT